MNIVQHHIKSCPSQFLSKVIIYVLIYVKGWPKWKSNKVWVGLNIPIWFLKYSALLPKKSHLVPKIHCITSQEVHLVSKIHCLASQEVHLVNKIWLIKYTALLPRKSIWLIKYTAVLPRKSIWFIKYTAVLPRKSIWFIKYTALLTGSPSASQNTLPCSQDLIDFIECLFEVIRPNVDQIENWVKFFLNIPTLVPRNLQCTRNANKKRNKVKFGVLRLNKITSPILVFRIISYAS